MSHFVSILRLRLKTSMQPKQFHDGREGFVKFGHFDKHFVKNLKKKCSAGENLTNFTPRFSQNYILNCKFNLNDKHNHVLVFQNQSNYFDFQKRGGKISLLCSPVVAHLKKQYIYKKTL